MPRSRSPILTRLHPFRSSPPLVMAFLGAGLKTPAPHGPTAPLGNWPPLSLLDLPPLGISWDLLGSGFLGSSLGDAQVGDPVLDGLHRPLLGRARGVARGRVGSHGGSQRFQPRHLGGGLGAELGAGHVLEARLVPDRIGQNVLESREALAQQGLEPLELARLAEAVVHLDHRGAEREHALLNVVLDRRRKLKGQLKATT
mmetsp:Transcript_71160/g.161045  ORF Transcript_71160/g.161045 Transcript_71160/m.161045 type:complete len:200 (-) Transcript_71160:281-880(-)